MSKGGYSDCLAVSFAVGHYAKQCHAFQAKSNREVGHMPVVRRRRCACDSCMLSCDSCMLSCDSCMLSCDSHVIVSGRVGRYLSHWQSCHCEQIS